MISRQSRNRWPLRLINLGGALGVTVLILWQTGLTSWRWFADDTVPRTPAVVTAPSRLPSKPIALAPPIPKGNDSSVSAVPLRLLLVNVHLGATLHEGSAEIGVVADSPQTYQAGAVLENGARIAEIHPDYVLLQKDGRSIRLVLEGKNGGRVATDSDLLMVGKAKETPPAAKITSSDTMTNYIRPAPLYEGDAIIGFQVYPASRPAVFYQMGLQPGDIITEINGSPMTDPATAWELFRQIAQGSVLAATVKRHGSMVSVNLDGTLLLNAEQARLQPAPPVLATASP